MIKISTFSKLVNMSIRTLRYYDEIGLLHPFHIDEESNYRFYTSNQIKRANQITQLKNMGFSLTEISNLLSDETDIKSTQTYFKLREKALQKELESITYQTKLLEKASQIINLKEDHFMNYSVVEKNIPKRAVISVKGVMPNYESEGVLWEKLHGEIMKQKVKFPKNSYSMAVYLDKEYKESDVEIEVQMAVEGTYEDRGDIRFYTAPETKVASVTFNGSYEQMPQVSEAIAHWVESNQCTISGPMMNIYHVSPAQDPNPDNWITEACFVITKKVN